MVFDMILILKLNGIDLEYKHPPNFGNEKTKLEYVHFPISKFIINCSYQYSMMLAQRQTNRAKEKI